MRRELLLLAVMGLVVSLAAVGCSKKVTVKTPDGEVEIRTDARDGEAVVKIDTPEGKMRITSKGGKGEVVVESEEGKVEIHTDAGKEVTTYSSEEGTVKVGKVDMSEKELGVPIYPGAERKYGADADTADGDSAQLFLQTSDPIDDVVAFYEEKLGAGKKVSDMQMPGSRMVMFAKEEGKVKVAVTIRRADSENTTNINIVRVVED